MSDNTEIPTVGFEFRVDAPFGSEVSGFEFTDRRGNPINAPPSASGTVTSSSPETATGEYLGGGRVWVKPTNGAPVGSTFSLVCSVNETGDKDDWIISGTLVAGVVGDTTVGAATMRELTEEPTRDV